MDAGWQFWFGVGLTVLFGASTIAISVLPDMKPRTKRILAGLFGLIALCGLVIVIVTVPGRWQSPIVLRWPITEARASSSQQESEGMRNARMRNEFEAALKNARYYGASGVPVKVVSVATASSHEQAQLFCNWFNEAGWPVLHDREHCVQAPTTYQPDDGVTVRLPASYDGAAISVALSRLAFDVSVRPTTASYITIEVGNHPNQ
jgi:hypothetical protein